MIKILCPTDFSEPADNAVAYAAALSKKVGAELTLFNVHSIMALPVVEMFEDEVLLVKPVVERLQTQCDQVQEVFAITCIAEVQPENESLTDIIAKRSKDFDLLVMGTNGADEYNDFFFGSHSYRVAIKAQIPVLLIPSSYRYKEITSLVYAYDYEAEQRFPMVQLGKWAKLLQAHVIVVKVKSHYLREEEVNAQQVEQRIVNSKELPGVTFDTVYEDDAFIGVHDYFIRNDYDALSLCSVQHNFITNIFHKSLIKALSAGADYPLFIFHL